MRGLSILPYLPYGYLLAALLIASVTDLKLRRIPNLVTYSTMVFALVVYTLIYGVDGLLFSLKGLFCGFVVLLIPYLLGGMGAGDVKLMAAVGAVLGAAGTFTAFLIIALLGGVTSLVVLAIRGECLSTLKRLWRALCAMFGGLGPAALRIDRPTIDQENLPYGVVIAGGTVVFVLYNIILGGADWPPIPV